MHDLTYQQSTSSPHSESIENRLRLASGELILAIYFSPSRQSVAMGVGGGDVQPWSYEVHDLQPRYDPELMQIPLLPGQVIGSPVRTSGEIMFFH